MQTTTVFNPIQLQLLRMFSHNDDDNVLLEIKQLLSEYFARKAEEGMAELWAHGQWDNEKNDNILKLHLRTPYAAK